MSLSSKSRRRKGHDFERWIAQYLSKYEILAERNLEYQSGHKGDINLKEYWLNNEFAIQCKDQIKPNVRAALEQCQSDCANKKCIAICHFKGQNKEESLVTMKLHDFILLFKALVKQDRSKKGLTKAD